MEYLDIVDENGIPTGQTASRADVHAKGLYYRAAHTWVMRRRGGCVQLLLQKRASWKDSFPGCYDISSAGHVPVGMNFMETALNELREELGFCAAPDELTDCGLHRMYADLEFHGKPFIDRQIARVYLLSRDVEAADIRFQREEIEDVRWFDFDACKEMARSGSILNCLDSDELNLIEEYL